MPYTRFTGLVTLVLTTAAGAVIWTEDDIGLRPETTGSDVGLAFKNALVNGGFSNWTAGTSFSNISGAGAAVEVADDWYFAQAGTASNAVSRQASANTANRYGYRMGRPAASVQTGKLRLFQALTTDEAYRMRGKTVTVSFSLHAGADFSGSNLAILIATGTTEGESAALMDGGTWGGQINALSETQVPTTVAARYEFTVALSASLKECGLQLSYSPTGTAGAADWAQFEDIQWEVSETATEFTAIPAYVERLRGKGIATPPRSKNLVVNGDCAVNWDRPATSADDTYALTTWNILTQTGTVAITQQTLQEARQATNGRMTQSQASAQRMAFSQIIEAIDSQDVRGQYVGLQARLRLSAGANVRAALLEWTGTADSVTSDVVSDWTSSSYTAGGFFNSTTLNVLAVSDAIALTANTWADITPLLGKVGASANNLILIVWTESTAAQNVTLDWGRVKVSEGPFLSAFEAEPLADNQLRCGRLYQKSFPDATAPVQNAGLNTSAISFVQVPGAATATFAPGVRFAPRMRISPTVTFYNPGVANAQARNSSVNADCSATTTNALGDAGFNLSVTTAAGSAANNYNSVNWSADARL